MRRKCLVASVIMALLAWTGAALATPLILDHYEAYAKVQNSNGEYLDVFDKNDPPVPPVSANVKTVAEDAEGLARSPDLDIGPNSLRTSAGAWYKGYYSSYAFSYMDSWKEEIIASTDSTQLRIKFDYFLEAKVNGSITEQGENGYAKITFHPVFYDVTAGGLFLWDFEDSLALDHSVGGEIIDYSFGSINEVINLTPGHKYVLDLYPFWAEALTWEGQESWAYGQITGVDLQIVPLPSTLLLASSGLLGLLALRRKRKF